MRISEQKHIELIILMGGSNWHFLWRLTVLDQFSENLDPLCGTKKNISNDNCKMILILKYSLHILTMQNIELKYGQIII